MGNLEIGSPRFKPSVDKGLRSFVWNVGLSLKKACKILLYGVTLNNVNLVK